MPIKNQSDKVRMPRLGKLHLGEKVQGREHTYPKATDYFVCPEEVRKVFGEQPKELRIMIPVEDFNLFAPEYLKRYSATRGLVCKGDGETANALVDTETGEIASKDSIHTELREINCDPEECEFYEKKHCRPVMNFMFLLPEVPGFGVWQIDTTSFYGRLNLRSALGPDGLIRQLAGGRVSMIPLLLRLGPQEVQVEGKKKTVHVMQITTTLTLSDLQRKALVPPGKALLVKADESRPEGLYPESVVAEEIAALKAAIVAEEAKRLKEPPPPPPIGETDTSGFSELKSASPAPPVEPPKEEKEREKPATAPTTAKVAPAPPSAVPVAKKAETDWEKRGYASAKEEIEDRKKVYRLLVDQLFKDKDNPIDAAKEWLHNQGFIGEGASKEQRQEIIAKVQNLMLEKLKLMKMLTDEVFKDEDDPKTAAQNWLKAQPTNDFRQLLNQAQKLLDIQKTI